MSKITLDNLSDNLKEYLEGLGLSEEQVLNLINENGLNEEELKEMLKDTMSINELSTNSKTVIGAINELFQSANNGKQLIASAIGEPVSADDTFQAMSNDINGLLSTFKTNMMNNGITIESGDKFKQLIDKIATMVEEGSGKGIRYASGTVSNESRIFTITDLGFTPSIVIFITENNIGNQNSCLVYSEEVCYEGYRSDYDTYSNIIEGGFTDPGDGYYYSGIYILDNGFEVRDPNEIFEKNNWFAVGVGEEDTTLRDSLASILEEEGASVTEEDDMASLINKVDEEFDRQVVPAGTAVAANVDSGKTFINSTGQLVTGTSTKVSPAGTAVASNVDSGKTFINSTGKVVTGTSTKVAPAGTAVASDVVSGKTFINSTGQLVTGTASLGYNIVPGDAIQFDSRMVYGTVDLTTTNKIISSELTVKYDGYYRVSSSFDVKLSNFSNVTLYYGVCYHTTSSDHVYVQAGKYTYSNQSGTDGIYLEKDIELKAGQNICIYARISSSSYPTSVEDVPIDLEGDLE